MAEDDPEFVQAMTEDECRAVLAWMSGYRPAWFGVVRGQVEEMRFRAAPGMAETGWQPGDRVLVHLPGGSPGVGPRWRWFPGTVREVDTGSRPGVRVDLDFPVNGVSDCYATHAELRRADA